MINSYKANVQKKNLICFEDYDNHRYEILPSDINGIKTDGTFYTVDVFDFYGDVNNINVTKETFDELLEILNSGI